MHWVDVATLHSRTCIHHHIALLQCLPFIGAAGRSSCAESRNNISIPGVSTLPPFSMSLQYKTRDGRYDQGSEERLVEAIQNGAWPVGRVVRELHAHSGRGLGDRKLSSQVEQWWRMSGLAPHSSARIANLTQWCVTTWAHNDNHLRDKYRETIIETP